MMEKFDSIYADSVNDEINFDVIFNGEGSLIESVDPDYFFNEDGEEKINESTEETNNIEEETVEEESEVSKMTSMSDLDSFLEDIDDGDSDSDDIEGPGVYTAESDDEDDDDEDDRDDDDDDEGYTGYISDEIDDDDFPRAFPKGQNRCEPQPRTIDDLDRKVDSMDCDKQVLHSGESVRDTNKMEDLDEYVDKLSADDEDNHLIDKVDNDDGSPDEEATPDDFSRPEDNPQDNSFEIGRNVSESITISDLDGAIMGLVPTGQSTLGPNIGLETEESEQPGSEEALDDGEDIDTIMDESFFDFF